MTTRSQRLAVHRSTLTKDAVILYTSPPGFVTLVKSFGITNYNSLSATVTLYFDSPGSSTAVVLFRKALAQVEYIEQQCWHVLEPGDSVRETTTLDLVDFWISGAVLPVPS